MSASLDPYAVLGVARTATKREIRAAYVARARQSHPDLVGGHGLDAMRALNEAWAILKDAAQRQAWDLANRPTSATAADAGAGNATAAPGGRAERPFWTGAMGPPPGRPLGHVLDFGIYDGWSLGEISRLDRGYLVWLRDRPEGRTLQAEINRLLDPSSDETAQPRRSRRHWYPGR